MSTPSLPSLVSEQHLIELRGHLSAGDLPRAQVLVSEIRRKVASDNPKGHALTVALIARMAMRQGGLTVAEALLGAATIQKLPPSVLVSKEERDQIALASTKDLSQASPPAAEQPPPPLPLQLKENSKFSMAEIGAAIKAGWDAADNRPEGIWHSIDVTVRGKTAVMLASKPTGRDHLAIMKVHVDQRGVALHRTFLLGEGDVVFPNAPPKTADAQTLLLWERIAGPLPDTLLPAIRKQIDDIVDQSSKTRSAAYAFLDGAFGFATDRMDTDEIQRRTRLVMGRTLDIGSAAEAKAALANLMRDNPGAIIEAFGIDVPARIKAALGVQSEAPLEDDDAAQGLAALSDEPPTAETPASATAAKGEMDEGTQSSGPATNDQTAIPAKADRTQSKVDGPEPIGVNEEGEYVYLGADGIRYVMQGNIQISQSIALTPRRDPDGRIRYDYTPTQSPRFEIVEALGPTRETTKASEPEAAETEPNPVDVTGKVAESAVGPAPVPEGTVILKDGYQLRTTANKDEMTIGYVQDNANKTFANLAIFKLSGNSKPKIRHFYGNEGIRNTVESVFDSWWSTRGESTTATAALDPEKPEAKQLASADTPSGAPETPVEAFHSAMQAYLSAGNNLTVATPIRVFEVTPALADALSIRKGRIALRSSGNYLILDREALERIADQIGIVAAEEVLGPAELFPDDLPTGVAADMRVSSVMYLPAYPFLMDQQGQRFIGVREVDGLLYAAPFVKGTRPYLDGDELQMFAMTPEARARLPKAIHRDLYWTGEHYTGKWQIEQPYRWSVGDEVRFVATNAAEDQEPVEGTIEAIAPNADGPGHLLTILTNTIEPSGFTQTRMRKVVMDTEGTVSPLLSNSNQSSATAIDLFTTMLTRPALQKTVAKLGYLGLNKLPQDKLRELPREPLIAFLLTHTIEQAVMATRPTIRREILAEVKGALRNIEHPDQAALLTLQTVLRNLQSSPVVGPGRDEDTPIGLKKNADVANDAETNGESTGLGVAISAEPVSEEFRKASEAYQLYSTLIIESLSEEDRKDLADKMGSAREGPLNDQAEAFAQWLLDAGKALPPLPENYNQYVRRLALEADLRRQLAASGELTSAKGTPFTTAKRAERFLDSLPRDGEFAQENFGVYRVDDGFVLRPWDKDGLGLGAIDSRWVDQSQAIDRRRWRRAEFMAEKGLVEDSFGNMMTPEELKAHQEEAVTTLAVDLSDLQGDIEAFEALLRKGGASLGDLNEKATNLTMKAESVEGNLAILGNSLDPQTIKDGNAAIDAAIALRSEAEVLISTAQGAGTTRVTASAPSAERQAENHVVADTHGEDIDGTGTEHKRVTDAMRAQFEAESQPGLKKSKGLLLAAVEDLDIEALAKILHFENKILRKMFTDTTGTKLPSTAKALPGALAQWAVKVDSDGMCIERYRTARARWAESIGGEDDPGVESTLRRDMDREGARVLARYAMYLNDRIDRRDICTGTWSGITIQSVKYSDSGPWCIDGLDHSSGTVISSKMALAIQNNPAIAWSPTTADLETKGKAVSRGRPASKTTFSLNDDPDYQKLPNAGLLPPGPERDALIERAWAALKRFDLAARQQNWDECSDQRKAMKDIIKEANNGTLFDSVDTAQFLGEQLRAKNLDDALFGQPYLGPVVGSYCRSIVDYDGLFKLQGCAFHVIDYKKPFVSETGYLSSFLNNADPRSLGNGSSFESLADMLRTHLDNQWEAKGGKFVSFARVWIDSDHPADEALHHAAKAILEAEGYSAPDWMGAAPGDATVGVPKRVKATVPEAEIPQMGFGF